MSTQSGLPADEDNLVSAIPLAFENAMHISSEILELRRKILTEDAAPSLPERQIDAVSSF